ncbi:GNAT family N-acetyltransferase [Pelagibacterium limicola]|uniref:GNAT family N-acetyltransferase n=1 Tax=Pelagibacterium limicola TaxID=2791022 RepID=UPI0018AF731F|nr:GNAT family N-acetyltransferase [Pelagibacterium limicola]
MRRDLSADFPEPSWPEGVVPVLFSETMAPELHTLLTAAYCKGEGDVSDFETWWHATRTDPEYDAELMLVAQGPNGALVGLAHCWNSAFLKDFAVLPGWRRQGIGEALLLRSFEACRNRYRTAIDLKVKPDNLAAIRLYRRVGFVPLD